MGRERAADEAGPPAAPPPESAPLLQPPPESALLLQPPPSPSLASGRGGSSTWWQALGNIVVSIIGTGVLGLPYAFRVAGWLAGSLGVAAAGLSIYYCMILLVQCRERIEEEEADVPSHIQSYGDLGAKAFGTSGRYLTEVLVLISQAGGAIAYLIFIGQNLSSVFSSTGIDHNTITPPIFIFLLLLPLEIFLSFFRSLDSLAPFSVFADVCNVLAMAIVVKEDLGVHDHSSKTRRAFNGPWGLPFAAGVSVFCFEGFSMTLPLEASMAQRRKFRLVLSQAFLVITLAYIFFGIFGYLAYGDETKDIITLNLPNNWSAAAVKVGLCVGLALTFPIMMHPVHDIMELKLNSSGWFQKLCYNVRGAERLGLLGVRMLMVVAVATLASLIPGFGAFISFIGSTVCAMLSFVLPSILHLKLVGPAMKFWQRVLDYCILLFGLVFACVGTYDALRGGSMGS